MNFLCGAPTYGLTGISPPKKATTFPRKGFINGLSLERNSCERRLNDMWLVCLGGATCSNIRKQRVYSLLAFEYRNAKGETIRMVHSFGITDIRIIGLISFLNRIFP